MWYLSLTQFNSTCRQSSAVTTIRGHFDWQASSKGKKYLSASINGCFPLGGGRADDGLSSLHNKTKTTTPYMYKHARKLHLLLIKSYSLLWRKDPQTSAVPCSRWIQVVYERSLKKLLFWYFLRCQKISLFYPWRDIGNSNTDEGHQGQNFEMKKLFMKGKLYC